MPTVILLDVSLSMSQIVPGNETTEELQRRNLAVHGINTLLDHLANKVKLEFVSLVIFSSLWEQVVGFTRDYDSIRAALKKIDEYNKTCIESALNGVGSLIMEEWGSSTQCQIILVTDGNAGVGEGSLKRSLQKYKDKLSANSSKDEDKFPLPYAFPCKLNIMCMSPPNDKQLENSLIFYDKLLEINKTGGQVYVPEGPLSEQSVETIFKKMAEDYFSPFLSNLKCGNLKCPVQVFPAPDSFKEDYDFECVEVAPGNEVIVCGFLTVADVASPPYLSRHLVLPITPSSNESDKKNSESVKIEEDDDKESDEAKAPAFTVLLHGSLKVEGMVALVTIQENWYGLLYSFADNKKKSNLMLSLFKPGSDLLPWLGNLKHLAPVGDFSEPPYGDDDKKTPFPVRPSDRRSYTQGCVVWIKQSGLQADIQKILRNARKIPEKQQHFYKELNKLRKAALSFGFFELLDSIAQLLERECTLLPNNAHPDATIQLTHAANALRQPSALDYSNNIIPLRTSYSTD